MNRSIDSRKLVEEEVMISVAVVVGVVIGAAATLLLGRSIMRTSMVVPQQSGRSFDETCAAIEKAVPDGDGWTFPVEPLDMYAKLEAKGHAPDGVRRIRLYFVCKPELASRVLSDSPRMSAIMPCSWAVYELDDGTVWLSKMNISMMSNVFRGEVKAAMRQVAAADEQFMAAIL